MSCIIWCFIKAVKVIIIAEKNPNLTSAGLRICCNATYLHTNIKHQRKH